jgi:hypothetical protein
MVIFLPLVLMLLVLSAIRGETNVILLLPMCLMLALGAVLCGDCPPGSPSSIFGALLAAP